MALYNKILKNSRGIAFFVVSQRKFVLHKKMKNDTIPSEVKKVIDIVKAKNAFKNYVKNYNPEDKQIKLKIEHIERTSQMSRKIAKSLKLPKEDIQLAELIGLLHDIGRFEQIKNYHTFVDKNSINHGKYGAKILFEKGIIRNFIETSKYDEIIKKAIINHNRDKIEEGLTQKELVHCKIIRDADKTDIFYLLTFSDIKITYETNNFPEEKITDEIYREFMEERKIDYSKKQNAADTIVSHFAYVFDFYFDFGLDYIEKNNYLEKLYERVQFKDEKTATRYKKVYETAKQFMKEKLAK